MPCLPIGTGDKEPGIFKVTNCRALLATKLLWVSWGLFWVSTSPSGSPASLTALKVLFIYLVNELHYLGWGETALWIKALSAKSNDPGLPYGRKRESTSTSCPSTYLLVACMCEHTHTHTTSFTTTSTPTSTTTSTSTTIPTTTTTCLWVITSILVGLNEMVVNGVQD